MPEAQIGHERAANATDHDTEDEGKNVECFNGKHVIMVLSCGVLSALFLLRMVSPLKLCASELDRVPK